MDIDQRLEFLLKSTESLHASVQELSTQIALLTKQSAEHRILMANMEAREHKARIAMLGAIKTYLQTMNNGDGTEG